MRSRTLVLLLVAFVLAIATAFLARSWLASERSRDIAEATPVSLPTAARSVLVARNELKRGQILRPDDLVWQVWPEGGLDRNYIVLGTKTPESFAGYVARNPISGGEPVTESKVIAPGARGFLAAVLRQGTRAISVPLTATSGVSGFVFPGDQVDLLITYTVTPVEDKSPTNNNSGNNEHKVAETVLRDLRVVAIDQKLDSKPGEPVVAHTATIEVTPKQAEIITLAGEMGKLSLSLRSLVPAESSTTKVAANESLGEDHPPASPDSGSSIDATYTVDSEVSSLLRPLNPQAEKKTQKNTDSVTILRGGSKGSEVVATEPGQKGS